MDVLVGMRRFQPMQVLKGKKIEKKNKIEKWNVKAAEEKDKIGGYLCGS